MSRKTWDIDLDLGASLGLGVLAVEFFPFSLLVCSDGWRSASSNFYLALLGQTVVAAGMCSSWEPGHWDFTAYFGLLGRYWEWEKRGGEDW